MAQTSSRLNWDEVGDEVVARLRDLLRLDTRNPPGNENRATDYLRTVLEQEGIACTVVGPQPDRATLIARLRGNGSEAPLLLMSHTDVVAVEPEKWSHPPFAAEIADGFLYGRGALDMKNMVTMELMILLLLKRTGVSLKRDIIFMAAADEEAGGHQGAEWVVDHHPELIQAEYALNEGGGYGLAINGQRYYTVQTAEKGSARFRLRARGVPGHGSIPRENNAILNLAELLLKLRQSRTPIHYTSTIRGYLTGVAQTQPPDLAQQLLAVLADESTADAVIAQLPVEETFKQELQAMLRNTISPTMLSAGSQINVIPSEAEVSLDARILPHQTLEQFRAELRVIFGEEAEIEFLDPSPAQEADPASPLFTIIKDVLKEYDAEATVIPTLLTGGTDAKHVSRLGTKIYGFAPELYLSEAEGENGIHGHDERIHIRALQWGLRVLYEVVIRFATSA